MALSWHSGPSAMGAHHARRNRRNWKPIDSFDANLACI